MQKPGNEEDQNREKAQGHSQSRCGWPVAKPVNASDQSSRGQSWSRRPTKKAKPAVNEGVQDWQDINNPPESWEVVLEAEQGGETSPRCSKKPPIQGLTGNDPQKTLLAFPPLQCLLCQLQLVDEPNIKGHQAKINLPVHPKLSTPYQEVVTVLKWENADMRQEIEVTHTELAALHQVVDAIHNHLFLAPDMLNHPLVPFHTTSNPTPVPHMPVMVELGTATSVVEVQSSQSGSRQESTETPLASFEGGAGLEVPPLNVKPVHGPAGGLAISITPPPPAVGSAPRQEGRMEVN
ncbi:hypothetical protein BKA82DRAFT_4018641 [Pisolithus tinctorius]|nr:hypothetical protein BKA82DRAFT_4018641 [Pisolithus tinctorius]